MEDIEGRGQEAQGKQGTINRDSLQTQLAGGQEGHFWSSPGWQTLEPVTTD